MENNNGYINRVKSGYAVTSACKGCGTCVDMCPTGAMNIIRKPSYIDQEICAKCGACYEVCDHGAIVKIG